jgi:putative nucleotidyltransferase with HDIG domain
MNRKTEIFYEIEQHLLNDKKPSEYFNRIPDGSLLEEFPFTMLGRLKETEQNLKYHPEGSVWNHTMLVVDAAAEVKEKSSYPRVFMWAALLHDIGKPGTTRVRKGRITSYDHDRLGAKLSADFLNEFDCDSSFIRDVSALVRWHMQLLFVTKSLAFANVDNMLSQVSMEDVGLLGLCDRMGRLGADRAEEEKNVALFLEKCRAYKANRQA